jgi:hypothetical protein
MRLGLIAARALGPAAYEQSVLMLALGHETAAAYANLCSRAAKHLRLEPAEVAIVLHRLAADADRLSYGIVHSVIGLCLPSLNSSLRMNVRANLACVIGLHNNLLSDYPELWSRLGSAVDRSRLIAAAYLISRDVIIASDDDLLRHVERLVASLPTDGQADP